MMVGVIYFGFDVNLFDGWLVYGDGYVNMVFYWVFVDFLNLVLVFVCFEECEVIFEVSYMGIISFIDFEVFLYNCVVRGIWVFFDGCV